MIEKSSEKIKVHTYQAFIIVIESIISIAIFYLELEDFTFTIDQSFNWSCLT